MMQETSSASIKVEFIPLGGIVLSEKASRPVQARL